MPVPDWVPDAIFYQIFPDRFANGDHNLDPDNAHPWGAPPTTWGFQGGDLRGILNHFDYLLDLGVNAIYLNPIFQATSNHRYNTTDYYKIDPKLGTLDDFRLLLDTAHRNGVRVILDGVFNHCGRGFFAFNDVLENNENSPYRDWFHILRFPVDAYGPNNATPDYLAWWGIRSLPKFNTDHLDVRHYLLDVARYWIEQGIDGWRLDVPSEINDDTFWEEFRHVVKTANPQAYLMGEIWTMDNRWVNETHFDGLMHYPIRDAILRLLYAGTLDIPQFFEKIEAPLEHYPSENLHAMYVLLGSHDTERLLTKLEGNPAKVKLAYLFQFAYPGTPAIYYGDEIGLLGGKDPACRGAFPWEASRWNNGLRQWVKTLIAERKRQPALRRGEYLRLCADPDSQCIAFARQLPEESVAVVLNPTPAAKTISLPVQALNWADGRVGRGIFGGQTYTVENGQISLMLSAWGGEWLA